MNSYTVERHGKFCGKAQETDEKIILQKDKILTINFLSAAR